MYPRYESRATPLIGEQSTLARLLRASRWTATLCALVLIIDVAFVTVIWADGVETFRGVVAEERRVLGLQVNAEAKLFIDMSTELAHDWVIERTGVGEWLSMMRQGPWSNVMNHGWVVVETAVLGLQLFAARLAVLVLSFPLFIAIGGTAIADGLFAWLMRRTSGARESGFIYHRAKRAVPAFLLVFWAVYLLPPTPLDPRWVLPPFIVAFAVALRLRVSYFKKHI